MEESPLMQFVEWMSAHLDDDVATHSYFNRKQRQRWQCESLYDAYSGYYWRHPDIERLRVPSGADFASSTRALNALRGELIEALNSRSDEATRIACVDVVLWGGVGHGNVKWFFDNEAGLSDVIETTRTALDSRDSMHAVLNDSGTLRFNAGMTKVYSLICEDFIIYDSRVAAALGWLVVKFCRSRAWTSVPPALCFPWAPANDGKTRHKKRRNASEATLVFPSLVSGPLHAKWNIQASQVLAAVLRHENARESRLMSIDSLSEQLRALEAALFMIGYNLDSNDDEVVMLVRNGIRSGERMMEQNSNWITLPMLRNGVCQYRVTDRGIDIDFSTDLTNIKHFSDQQLDATLTYLWKHFETGPFPLANQADAVADGTANDGLGTAFRTAAKGNPPDTSRLGVVFEHLNVFTRYVQCGVRATNWTLNAQALGLSPDDDNVRIRPLLDRNR
jgi:hypothetical protein